VPRNMESQGRKSEVARNASDLMLRSGPHTFVMVTANVHDQASLASTRSRNGGPFTRCHATRHRTDSRPQGVQIYFFSRTVNPRSVSTATAPTFPPSKSPEARRWPVASSYAAPRIALCG